MTLYFVRADTADGENHDLFVRQNDGGTYDRDAVLKIWRDYYEYDLEDPSDPIRIFAVNETTVGALAWHDPDGCKLVETVD